MEKRKNGIDFQSSLITQYPAMRNKQAKQGTDADYMKKKVATSLNHEAVGCMK
jgi:hypothetical protein